MTDWELISSQIQRAMAAVEDAHMVSQALRDEPTPEKLTKFQKKMGELARELDNIEYFLEHEDMVFSDDVSDVLSEIFTGKPAPYRKTHRS